MVTKLRLFACHISKGKNHMIHKTESLCQLLPSGEGLMTCTGLHRKGLYASLLSVHSSHSLLTDLHAFLIFSEYHIITIFLTPNPVIYPSLFSFQFMASSFTHCYYMYICIYIHSICYLHLFRADHLALKNHLVCSFYLDFYVDDLIIRVKGPSIYV